MTAKAQHGPLFKAWDRNGAPLAGGKVHTHAAGTSTPKATFQDAAGGAAHPNPVVLNAAGEAAIFWGFGLYKVRVEDSAGVLQWEVDGFDPQVIDLPAPAEDLIDNGSFEADTDGDGTPDGWSFTTYTGGTADVDRYDADTNPTPDVLHGEAALRFVSPGGAGNGGGYADQADYFEVAEGEDLDVAFWIKSTADVHNKVDIRWFTSAKAAHGTPQTTLYDEAAANPTSWTEKRYKVTPPAGARFAKVRLYGCVDDDATAGTTRYDHVTVRAVQPQYLRADVADRVDGELTHAADVVLNNGIWLRGKHTGGTALALIQMSSSNRVEVGTPAANFEINSAGNLTHNEAALYQAGGTDVAVADGGTGASDAATARSNLSDTISGYTRLGQLYIDSDSLAAAGDAVNVHTTLTEDTWESIGPTGSGADNIWSKLDDLPSNASAVRLLVEMSISNTSTSLAALYLYYRVGGSSTGAGSTRAVKRLDIKGDGTNQSTQRQVGYVDVPLDGSLTFDLYWSDAATNPEGESINIGLAGFWVP